MLGNNLVYEVGKIHANMTNLNHLGNDLRNKPKQMFGVMNHLFSSQIWSENPLMKILSSHKRYKKEVEGLEYGWDLQSNHVRPLIIISNVMPASNQKLGYLNTSFKLKFDTNFLLIGDVIVAGEGPKNIQARCMSRASRHGNGWVYTFQLMGNNSKQYVNLRYVRPGQKWAKLFSQYGEANKLRGSTQFTKKLELSNKLSKYAKRYEITDYAQSEVLSMAIIDANGKAHKKWFPYAEAIYWKQWHRELERGFWYSRSTDTVLDENGYPVTSGAGIHEQLEKSYREPYSVLTGELLRDYLMSVFYSKTSPSTEQRRMKAYTGEYGMEIFSDAMLDWQKRKGFVINADMVSSQVKSSQHKNALSMGHKIVEYQFVNGATLTLEHNPLYDDPNINMAIDEQTGRPIESQRFTFLDFTGENGGSNIHLVKKKGAAAFGYLNGMHTPFGPATKGQKSMYISHAGSYTSMHVQDVCGAGIVDVSKCGELYLARGY